MQFSFRRSATVVAALALSVTLAACSGSDEPEATPDPTPTAAATTAAPTPTPTPTPTPEPEPTTINDLAEIQIDGDFEQPVTVTVPAPMQVEETLTEVLVDGSGATVPENAQVRVHYTGVNGRTGEVFDSSWSRGEEPTTFRLDQVVTGFAKGLTGQQVGSRVVIAMTGEDGYDSMGGNPPLIEVGDTLVFVVDIIETQLPGPSGETVEPATGLPTVSGDADAPEVSIPDSEPPAELVVQTLIKGEGAEIAASDTIIADYQLLSWSTGEVLDESYGANPASGQVSRLIQGWAQGIPGQTVGSRVLLVIPPELAFGDSGDPDLGIEGGDTLVYVVDLLMATAE